jgi:hypothetical protein
MWAIPVLDEVRLLRNPINGIERRLQVLVIDISMYVVSI